jgi:hypothetical protein
MSESEVYRRAFAEYQAARERVREVVEIARDIADLLKEPQRFNLKTHPDPEQTPQWGPAQLPGLFAWLFSPPDRVRLPNRISGLTKPRGLSSALSVHLVA